MLLMPIGRQDAPGMPDPIAGRGVFIGRGRRGGHRSRDRGAGVESQGGWGSDTAQWVRAQYEVFRTKKLPLTFLATRAPVAALQVAYPKP